jgi:putative DNA primase/helicase
MSPEQREALINTSLLYLREDKPLADIREKMFRGVPGIMIPQVDDILGEAEKRFSAEAAPVIPAPTQPVTGTEGSSSSIILEDGSKTGVDPLPDLPNLFKKIPNWIWWRLETRDGNTTKVPYIAGTNRHASSTDPATWTTYQNAVNNAVLGAESGLGFVVNGVEQILGFDLDGCRNPETGELTEWADTIINSLDSYTEITPSLTGVRVWVRGVLPQGDRVFNLDISAGFGQKVKIEVFESGRYFTVTGASLFEEALDVESRDLTEVYRLCHDIRAKFPATRTKSSATETKSEPVRVVSQPGALTPDKLTVFMTGRVKSTMPFVIEDGYGNSLEYPSHSEADLALATCLAIKHGNNPDLILADFVKSPLCRQKWQDREDYRNETIKKAITSADKILSKPGTPVIQQTTASQIAEPVENSADSIPPFDASVITGIYAKFVNLITRGTTLAPQFAFLAAKVVVGARMAGKVHFENLDAEPRYYGAAIGETGSGKGEAWRRMMQILNAQGALGGVNSASGIKIINSADSGAGIRDVFFEHPEDQPVLCYVDEVESLGNKATATRNPAILDMIIELANSTQISRTKAKKKGDSFSGTKTTNAARFCMFMCGQDGDVYMKAFAGRTKLGMWDRLYPEFGTAVEAGELPPINNIDAYNLLNELNKLDYSGTMKMSPEAKALFDEFWTKQPKEIRSKARWKNNLVMDAYMAAFGRGLKQVEAQDMDIAIRIFTRQLAIRQTCFRNEVPDRIGFYFGKIKDLAEKMRYRLKSGAAPETVALSRRDFETLSNAYRDNETHIFERAWRAFEPTWLMAVKIRKANGQEYIKYLPFEE